MNVKEHVQNMSNFFRVSVCVTMPNSHLCVCNIIILLVDVNHNPKNKKKQIRNQRVSTIDKKNTKTKKNRHNKYSFRQFISPISVLIFKFIFQFHT